MALPLVVPEDLLVQGNATILGTLSPPIPRSSLLQEDGARYKIPMVAWRVHDAIQTNLPGTGATDDLAIVSGTLGTSAPSIQTGDLKAAGATTRYARCTFDLPHEYVAGQTVTLRAKAGMLTTVADTSATIDFQVYRADDGTLEGSDICATAATTINSLTFANKDFTITPTSLLPGDTLDIRLAITVTDGATATAVIGAAGGIELLLDVKG